MSGGRGIFAGVNLLEFGSGAAGPVASRYFSEQGARVIRIESTRRPDFLRVLFLTRDSKFGMDGSPMFILLNPNKESLTLNLAAAEGQEIAWELVRWADVVCENFSPGVMEKWGLGAESLRARKPELIVAQGCLFGQTGPQRQYPGFGGQGSAIAGFNHLTGWPDREGHGPYGTITDSLSPRYLAVAVAAALLERRRTGRGRTIDLSQIESGVYSLSEAAVRYSANGEVVARAGNHCEHAAPHAIYPCAGDDRWIAIAVFSDEEWSALVRAMGNPEWARDERLATEEGRLAHREELDERLAEWTRDFPPHELMATLQARGVQAGAVQNFQDLLDDPQLAYRGHFQSLAHAHLGPMQFERSGFRLSASPGSLRSPGPNLGEHNRAILGELLGKSSATIDRLAQDDVLA